MPAGWLVFDGDGQTAHPNVSQFTTAWIVAEDFDIAGEFVAMSTSWYQPLTGPSNDWMCTPQIALTTNNELRWIGEAQDPQYPDGYEVRLTTGSQSPANTTNYSNNIFTISAEVGGVRTLRSVNLQGAGFSNQNVHIAYRNNSLDQFVLCIDDVQVRVAVTDDVEMEAAEGSEYTIIPLSQASAIPLNGTIANRGVATANGVTMTVNVYDGAFTQVSTQTSAAQNIAVGASANFSVPAFTPTAPDFYVFEYIANFATDGDSNNDTLYLGLLVDDSTMARDDGNVVGSLGIGAGNGGILGQIYGLNTPAQLTSVSFFFVPDIGQTYQVDVYDWNTALGTPGTVIGSTVPFVATVDTAVYLTVPINGTLSLPADTFYIGLKEPDSTLSLAYSNDIFLPEVTFLDWPTNPNGMWSNNEDFSFNVVYVLRANLDACTGYTLTPTITNASCGASDGAISLTPSGGSSPYTYTWSNGGNTATISNLAAGNYTVTVTDALGCEEISTYGVSNIGGPTLSSSNVTHVSCNGASDGSITVTVASGTPPYSYSWSNGQTSATASNLGGGTYFLTVTDNAGCILVTSGTVVEPSALTSTSTSTDESCTSCNDGTASVTPTGGTQPYTYAWSNGSTTASVSGLAPGTYSVTVTDANNCTTTQTVTISAFVSIDQALALDVKVFPNPNQGQFTMEINTAAMEDIKVEIYGTLGQMVWSDVKIGTTTYQRDFNATDLAAGRYMVKVYAGDKVTLRKLVIE